MVTRLGLNSYYNFFRTAGIINTIVQYLVICSL